MIGFFVFEETPTVQQPLVIAHLKANDGVKGYFYTRTADASDLSTAATGSTFFGVLDDASGFGACLFVQDLDVEADALLLQKNLHVKGNAVVDTDLTVKQSATINGGETIKGTLTVHSNIKCDGQLTASSLNTSIALTAAHAAAIVAAASSGASVPLVGVRVDMLNG